jgi:hypothetical protein
MQPDFLNVVENSSVLELEDACQEQRVEKVSLSPFSQPRQTLYTRLG